MNLAPLPRRCPCCNWTLFQDVCINKNCSEGSKFYADLDLIEETSIPRPHIERRGFEMLATKIACSATGSSEDEVKKFDPMLIIAIVQIIAQLAPMLTDCMGWEESKPSKAAEASKQLANRPLRRVFYRRQLARAVRNHLPDDEKQLTWAIVDSMFDVAEKEDVDVIESEFQFALDQQAVGFTGVV